MTQDPDTEITCEELANLWLLYLKRVRVYALLTGKLQPCSAGEEQEDRDVCDPVYVTAGGVDMLLVKAPMLVFVAACISVLCVCVIVHMCASCWENTQPLLLPGPISGSISPSVYGTRTGDTFWFCKSIAFDFS